MMGVPVETRRQRLSPTHVCVRNQMWILWKGSQCSYKPSLQHPSCLFFLSLLFFSVFEASKEIPSIKINIFICQPLFIRVWPYRLTLYQDTWIGSYWPHYNTIYVVYITTYTLEELVWRSTTCMFYIETCTRTLSGCCVGMPLATYMFYIGTFACTLSCVVLEYH